MSIAMFALLFWGIIHGEFNETWRDWSGVGTWVRSLYFVVAGMSTAGLQGPDVSTEASMISAAFISFLGVPIFTVVFGLVAGKFTELDKKADEKKRQLEGIKFDELVALNRIKTNLNRENANQGSLDYTEFLILELLRNDLCDEDFIKKTVKRFDLIDITDDGLLNIEEMVAHNYFEKFCVADKPSLGNSNERVNEGSMTFREFCTCVEEMSKTECFQRHLKEIVEDYDTEVELKEKFCTFSQAYPPRSYEIMERERKVAAMDVEFLTELNSKMIPVIEGILIERRKTSGLRNRSVSSWRGCREEAVLLMINPLTSLNLE